MRDIEFPNSPSGYEFMNWLYCPECGGKAGMYRYSPDFELSCDECGHEMSVTLGQTPPFHKVTPKHIEQAAERNSEHGAMPYQRINPAMKLREMDDEKVVRELEKAGYHELAETLSSSND